MHLTGILGTEAMEAIGVAWFRLLLCLSDTQHLWHTLIHRALMARIVRASVLQTVHCGTTSHAYGKKMQRLDVELSAMRQRTM